MLRLQIWQHSSYQFLQCSGVYIAQHSPWDWNEYLPTFTIILFSEMSENIPYLRRIWGFIPSTTFHPGPSHCCKDLSDLSGFVLALEVRDLIRFNSRPYWGKPNGFHELVIRPYFRSKKNGGVVTLGWGRVDCLNFFRGKFLCSNSQAKPLCATVHLGGG